MKEPGPDHPITITPHGRRVRVLAGGTVVAQTDRALALKEASYNPILYIPREDVRWDLFAHNPRTTHCPYKGEASYYDLTVGGATHAAAVWSYEAPFPAVAPIKDHLAFYLDKVGAIEEVCRHQGSRRTELQDERCTGRPNKIFRHRGVFRCS